MRPKILLATTCRWVAPARLAMAFRHAGCEVDMVCPAGHPVVHTGACGRTYRYHGLAPLDSICAAMEDGRPKMVIPCDDLACTHLHEIHAQAVRQGDSGKEVRALVERSLGDPANYSLVDARSRLIALARELGVATPETGAISSVEELPGWIAQLGLPLVLKTDGTSGGVGVRIVASEEEAVRAFRKLDAPPRLSRVIKRAIFDQDRTLFAPWLQRRRPVVNVQRYLPSSDATIAVACWRGEILASISTEVLRTWRPRGPSSVVRLINNRETNREMLQGAEKIVSHLKLSGLCGFDFVVEQKTGKAYLIEMNPRATQTCHLPLGTGHNLPVALAAAVSEEAQPQTASVTDGEVIALFPLEWQNDGASPFLRTAYHDVPWEEPRLVQFCARSKLNNGGWLTYENLDRMLALLPWRRS